MFCNHCVDDRISNRMRKCPNCSRAFDKMDVMTAHMWAGRCRFPPSGDSLQIIHVQGYLISMESLVSTNTREISLPCYTCKVQLDFSSQGVTGAGCKWDLPGYSWDVMVPVVNYTLLSFPWRRLFSNGAFRWIPYLLGNGGVELDIPIDGF